MTTIQGLEVEFFEVVDNTIILWAITGQEFYCTTEQFRKLLSLIQDDTIDIAVVGGLEVLEKIDDPSITLDCNVALSSKYGSNRIMISNSIWDYELRLDIQELVFSEILISI